MDRPRTRRKDAALRMRVPSALKQKLAEEAGAAKKSSSDLAEQILERGLNDLAWARGLAPPAPTAPSIDDSKEGAAA